jgi:NADH-quinone oxidoreductase subunit M
MVFIGMSGIGLPGLNGFVGEVLVLFGMYDFQGNHATAPVNGRLLVTLATFGAVLGAWYTLTLLLRLFFGPVREPGHGAAHAPAHAPASGHAEHGEPTRDLERRELAALVPIAALCLFIGLCPQPLIDSVRPDIRVVTKITEGARARADARARGDAKPSSSVAAATNHPKD